MARRPAVVVVGLGAVVLWGVVRVLGPDGLPAGPSGEPGTAGNGASAAAGPSAGLSAGPSGAPSAGWSPAPFSPPAGVPRGAEPARVVSHVDGDTLRLVGLSGGRLLPTRGEVSVRLLEIDTPELARPGQREECHAREAGEALADLLPTGAEVWVSRDEELYDPYGRMLLYLWTDEGRFVNLEMVKQGYARAVLFEPNDAHIDRMRRAEGEARAAGRGLWGACR